MENLAQRLKRLRVARKLSAQKVAQAVGIAESTYREWEYGRQIRGEPYARLSEVLGVTLSELLLGAESDRLAIRKELDAIEDAVRRIKKQL